MLRLAVVFLVGALIAGAYGYLGVAGVAWQGAKTLFLIFLSVAVLLFVGCVHRDPSID